MKSVNKVNALCGCSVFGAMSFTVIAATASSSGLRYRRHRAAMMSMLQFLVAQSCMSCHGMQMLATSLRVRIDCGTGHHATCTHAGPLCIQRRLWFHESRGAVRVSVTQCALLLCSLGGAGRLSGIKLSIFFLIAIVRSITFLSGLPEAKRSNRSLRGEKCGPKLTPFLPE